LGGVVRRRRRLRAGRLALPGCGCGGGFGRRFFSVPVSVLGSAPDPSSRGCATVGVPRQGRFASLDPARQPWLLWLCARGRGRTGSSPSSWGGGCRLVGCKGSDRFSPTPVRPPAGRCRRSRAGEVLTNSSSFAGWVVSSVKGRGGSRRFWFVRRVGGVVGRGAGRLSSALVCHPAASGWGLGRVAFRHGVV
jgi:hypothetical protein